MASGNMTSLQESVDCGGWGSQIDSVQCVARCHPQWREMCHVTLVEMKRLVEVEVEMEVTSLPLLSIPLSFMDLYLVSPFFILTLPSSILRQPHASRSAPTSSLWASVIHLIYLTIPANESSYLGSVRAEIRVSFIILYKPLSPLPGTNSIGNRTVNPDHFIIIISYKALWREAAEILWCPVWKGEP